MESHGSTSEIELRALLGKVLGLTQDRASALTASSPLFGALPELDSMAVAGVLTGIEDHFHITIDDDEVNGAMFETFGALTDFVERKTRHRE